MIEAETHCATVVSTMEEKVGVREFRQNISRYLDRVKEGEAFVVTEHGREVARLVPSPAAVYIRAAELYGATIPTGRLGDTIRRLLPQIPPSPEGTTDAILDDLRADRDYC